MEPPPKQRRGLWSVQQLEAAMAAVQGGLMSQRSAAAQYSIPRRTLVNHLKSGKVEKQIGRRTVLTKEQENDLAERIKRLAAIGFPLTPNVIRRQAYIFCNQYNISNNFSTTARRAGKDWLKLFLKRHPDISKRKVQILNPGRAQKLNKSIVMQHFTEYKKIYEELEIGQNPQRLYNMDEKGCRLTVHNQPTVLAQKGIKRVHMVAPEHAENVTVACCVNALGSPIPPMILFRGKRMKPEFRDNLPAGSLVKMSKKGSMTSELFVDFIHHLGKYKSAGKCLLVFDGASCHLDYNIVDAAEQNNTVLYCLPSNTTHELQPLDKSVNKSFEYHWNEEAMRYLYQSREKNITKARFNPIFRNVWSKCMTLDNIINGFRATGLYPFNPDAIPNEAYAPSILTERQSVAPENMTTQNNELLQCVPNSSRRTTPRKPASNGSDSEETFCEEQENEQFLQESPTPGPSGINLHHAGQGPDDRFDSDESFEIHATCSPSLLYQTEPMSLGLTGAGIKKRLVDYSSTNSDLSNLNIPMGGSKSDVIIKRPIIYSSESDTSIIEIFLHRQKCISQNIHNVYSSSDDENIHPMSKQQQTPKKQNTCNYIYNTQEGREDYATTSDSEDNLPLSTLQAKNAVKSPFQQLIPTPNFAQVKQKKPRRKAINYKARIVTKDLFADSVRQKNEKAKKQHYQKKAKKCEKERTEKHRNDKKQKFKGRSQKKKNQTQSKKTKHVSDTEIDKWYCYACKTERFEDMRQCPNCQRWFHEDCLGLTKEDIDFDCPMCN